MIVQQNIEFAIHDFAAILKTFYRGGEQEHILNNDLDASLFDEKFIVFEIDKVKDDPILFPLIVLIIMDVFTQKMRIKKGRKCLVIEEAWKAIATPVMANYIKYLYKTARKHWAMVGVVTQEIQDITSSPIVKEAIVNNSDVFMLLDRSQKPHDASVPEYLLHAHIPVLPKLNWNCVSMALTTRKAGLRSRRSLSREVWWAMSLEWRNLLSAIWPTRRRSRRKKH